MFPPIFSSFFCFPPFFCQLCRCIVFKICWIEVHCHWQRLEIERHQQPASGAGGSLTDRRFDVNEIHAIVTVQSFLLLHKWPNFSRYYYYDNCPNGPAHPAAKWTIWLTKTVEREEQTKARTRKAQWTDDGERSQANALLKKLLISVCYYSIVQIRAALTSNSTGYC